MASELNIRPASASDADAVTRLARTVGERRPPDPYLVAEIDGRVRAAISLRGGPVIADATTAGMGVAGRLRLAAAEEVNRRQTEEQRARSRRLRSTFARIGA